MLTDSGGLARALNLGYEECLVVCTEVAGSHFLDVTCFPLKQVGGVSGVGGVGGRRLNTVSDQCKPMGCVTFGKEKLVLQDTNAALFVASV